MEAVKVGNFEYSIGSKISCAQRGYSGDIRGIFRVKRVWCLLIIPGSTSLTREKSNSKPKKHTEYRQWHRSLEHIVYTWYTVHSHHTCLESLSLSSALQRTYSPLPFPLTQKKHGAPPEIFRAGRIDKGSDAWTGSRSIHYNLKIGGRFCPIACLLKSSNKITRSITESNCCSAVVH